MNNIYLVYLRITPQGLANYNHRFNPWHKNVQSSPNSAWVEYAGNTFNCRMVGVRTLPFTAGFASCHSQLKPIPGLQAQQRIKI